nr:hypothetical protein [Pseudoalteromonas undina]
MVKVVSSGIGIALLTP